MNRVPYSKGGVALWQSNRADNQSRLAQSRFLTSQANSLVDSQPDVALLLAATAYKIEETTEAVEALTRMASEVRHVDAPHLVALVRAGATFEAGKLIERPDEPPHPEAA